MSTILVHYFCVYISYSLNPGINRIGNTLVPNNNYVQFEKWITPILDSMLKEQKDRVPPFFNNKSPPPFFLNHHVVLVCVSDYCRCRASLFFEIQDPPVWSPSAVINRLGKEVANEESIYYWCWKVPILFFCCYFFTIV